MKTLKDLKKVKVANQAFYTDAKQIDEYVDYEGLRQAAIECVKAERKYYRDAQDRAINQAMTAARIDIMMEFFNLTEEDLK